MIFIKIELVIIKALFNLGLFFVNTAGYFSKRRQAIITGIKPEGIKNSPEAKNTRLTIDLDAKQAKFLERSIELLKKQYMRNTGKNPGPNFQNDAIVDLISRGIFSANEGSPANLLTLSKIMFSLN